MNADQIWGGQPHQCQCTPDVAEFLSVPIDARDKSAKISREGFVPFSRDFLNIEGFHFVARAVIHSAILIAQAKKPHQGIGFFATLSS
jgi:hypothetical protein